MPQVLNSIFGWPKAEVGFQLFWNLVNRLVYLHFWIFKIRHNNLLFLSSYNVYYSCLVALTVMIKHESVFTQLPFNTDKMNQ